jgi:dTDP-4-dehydrorhamnose reductase
MITDAHKSRKRDTTLIFGGSGLLGIHCIETLSSTFNIIPTYNQTRITNDKLEFFSFPTTMENIVKILLKHKPQYIINTIGLVNVNQCEIKRDLAYDLNVKFIQFLVQALENTNLNNTQLIHISTASVYGRHECQNTPWAEDDKKNPISIYSQTKLMGEKEVMKYKGPITILRTDVYGINPYSNNSLLWWACNELSNKKIIQGWDNIFFSPVSASMLSRIIAVIMKEELNGIYNVASRDYCSKYHFLSELADLIGRTNMVERVMLDQQEDAIRPEYTVLNNQRLSSIIDVDFSWKDDLASYIKDLN